MSVSKVLMAVSLARRGLSSSTQLSSLAIELCHVPGEVHLFSHIGLCSLELQPEPTHSLLCVYNELQGEMSLCFSLNACTEST